MATQIAWILLAANHRLQGLAAAADRDQANLIHAAVQRLAELNPRLCRGLEFPRHQVRSARSGSTLEIISSHVGSSWGALPDFIICDELCHWEKPDLWYSLASSAAKKANCLLAVLTNAGVGRGWQWDVRENARTSPLWHFSTLDGPHAPWITDAWLDEQRRLLPEPVFARLWLNQWQASDGQFVTLAEAEACRDESLTIRDKAEPGCRYVAALDYAEKHDYTVGCVCHLVDGRVIVDRMDVVVPQTDVPTPVDWVVNWIHRIAAAFPGTRFILDPYQLIGVIQSLESLYDLSRFEFAGGRGNHELATTLRRLILNGEITWYPGCGDIPAPRRNDLETELASLLLRQSASGYIRIDHHRDGVHHDDRAFTLGVCCLELTRGCADSDFLEITPPTSGGLAW